MLTVHFMICNVVCLYRSECTKTNVKCDMSYFHTHILYFIKLYRKCVNKIQLYFDEEEDRRLRWVKFCYGVMMLTQVFILVYLNLPRTFMKAWILWYSLFMLYFTANFISFVGSHKLMLDAFAHTTLSGRDLKKKFDEARNVVLTKNKKKVEKEPVAMPGYDDSAIIRLENALNRWVAEKKFCEFDKTRDDIAAIGEALGNL
mgnify:CR=1 FL=1